MKRLFFIAAFFGLLFTNFRCQKDTMKFDLSLDRKDKNSLPWQMSESEDFTVFAKSVFLIDRKVRQNLDLPKLKSLLDKGDKTEAGILELTKCLSFEGPEDLQKHFNDVFEAKQKLSSAYPLLSVTTKEKQKELLVEALLNWRDKNLSSFEVVERGPCIDSCMMNYDACTNGAFSNWLGNILQVGSAGAAGGFYFGGPFGGFAGFCVGFGIATYGYGSQMDECDAALDQCFYVCIH